MKLGDKFPTIDKFKECLTYYALANELSLWFDRTSKQKDVAKRGQRKEIIKDPRESLHFRNAKNFALNESDAAIHDHYGLLRSYPKALADSNEGRTVKVGVIVNPYEKTYFDRTSQSRQHEFRKSPTAELFDVDSGRISIHHKEAIHLLLTRIRDEIYSTVDACKTAHEMWIAVERLQQASEEDSDPKQAQRDKDMQKNLALIVKYFKKIYKPTNNNLRTSSNTQNKNVARKLKRAKDYTYHKENMSMCKQVENCVPLQAEKANWLEDTDEKVD
ncbi:hypothetical protein Tco_1406674 [Tanacetum coccineum]